MVRNNSWLRRKTNRGLAWHDFRNSRLDPFMGCIIFRLIKKWFSFYFCDVIAIHVLKIAAVNEQLGEYKFEVGRGGTV
jgi:hypothetical protein